MALKLEDGHKTVTNLKVRKVFTLAASDFLGSTSANKVEDKFTCACLRTVKSSRVSAPVITVYLLALKCKVVEVRTGTTVYR